jgi:hypothetical protein
VEVRIGVQHAPRELVIESEQSADDVEKAVRSATAKGAGGMLTLVDAKGRRVAVPADKIAYVDIDEPGPRRVGFGAG